MKKKSVVKKLYWVLAICCVTGLALSACKSTDEHPTSEHPKQEHPGTNAPPKSP